MKPLKAILGLLPGGEKLYQERARRRRERRLARLGDPEARFTHFYLTNKWKNRESRSGPGSTLEYTRQIRMELPGLFERFGVASVLDAPCGDYHWFRHVERPGVQYIGGDIVRPLVDANQRQYGDERTEFLHLDIVNDALPKADLWLCRDCLPHLSNADIERVIENFLRSDIRYWLTSVHPECLENRDIPTGSFRGLNLECDPFRFGPPLLRIDDWIEGFPVRQLALWEREAVAANRG